MPGLLPEHLYGGGTATNFANLATLASTRFFLAKTKHRVVVVLSDAEGPSFDAAATAAALKHAHIRLVFVRFGSPHDRIWIRRPHQHPILDPKFESDLSDLGEVRLLAGETGGAFYRSGQLGAAIARVDRLVGHGPDRPGEPLSFYADSLAPYAVLAALPLLAWLAGGLLPLSAPLGLRIAQRGRAALSNQE